MLGGSVNNGPRPARTAGVHTGLSQSLSGGVTPWHSLSGCALCFATSSSHSLKSLCKIRTLRANDGDIRTRDRARLVPFIGRGLALRYSVRSFPLMRVAGLIRHPVKPRLSGAVRGGSDWRHRLSDQCGSEVHQVVHDRAHQDHAGHFGSSLMPFKLSRLFWTNRYRSSGDRTV